MRFLEGEQACIIVKIREEPVSYFCFWLKSATNTKGGFKYKALQTQKSRAKTVVIILGIRSLTETAMKINVFCKVGANLNE